MFEKEERGLEYTEYIYTLCDVRLTQQKHHTMYMHAHMYILYQTAPVSLT